MTSGWSLKVSPLLEEAAVAGAGAGAAAGSEGADIVGRSAGEERARDLACAGSGCDGDGVEPRGLGTWGWGICCSVPLCCGVSRARFGLPCAAGEAWTVLSLLFF